ncbi:MAG: extracellular solute-binding protein [Candidatus Bipolaricaulia bacterium]
MLNRILTIGIAIAVLGFALPMVSALGQEPEVVTLRASVIGPGPMGVKKATNLELAAERLNEMLRVSGASVQVNVDVEFSELKWGPFADKFYLDFRAGQAPDIVTMRETADLAKGGFIIPLDDHVNAFWDLNYYDFYPNLWEGAVWNGKIWGIPHDVSPSGIWYRKDVLRELGYSDAEIAQMLPTSGDVSLDVLAKLAKETVDAGLVEFGILHRPSSGSNFYGTLLAFGVEAYDPEKDALALNKPAMRGFYEWHAEMVRQGVIPAEPPPWGTIHGTFVEGKTFSTWASHVGTPSEWAAKYGLTDESLKQDLGFIPFLPATPEVSPVSVNDYPLYFVTSQSKHPEIAALLLMFATSPEAAAIHSAFSLRPPYRRSAVYHPLIADNDYLQVVASSAETVRPVPIHPKFWAYMGRAFEALKGVEAGIISPAQAVQDLEAFLRIEAPDAVIIGR